MARIRSLKPDLWMSPQVMNLGHGARLLFIGLITQADDEGRGAADLRRLKASIFGGDDITSTDVRRMLDECNAQGLVEVFESENHGLVYVLPSWKAHQSIDRPRKSNYPDAPPRRTLVEPSSSPRRGLEGMEGNGEEGKEGSPRAREPSDTFDLLTEVQAAYPPGTYTGVTWHQAERELGKLLDEGVPSGTILRAVSDYHAQQHALGKVGTQFVRSPKSFFADGHWRGPFPLPPTKSEQRQDSNVAAGLAFLQGETS